MPPSAFCHPSLTHTLPDILAQEWLSLIMNHVEDKLPSFKPNELPVALWALTHLKAEVDHSFMVGGCVCLLCRCAYTPMCRGAGRGQGRRNVDLPIPFAWPCSSHMPSA